MKKSQSDRMSSLALDNQNEQTDSIDRAAVCRAEKTKVPGTEEPAVPGRDVTEWRPALGAFSVETGYPRFLLWYPA